MGGSTHRVVKGEEVVVEIFKQHLFVFDAKVASIRFFDLRTLGNDLDTFDRVFVFDVIGFGSGGQALISRSQFVVGLLVFRVDFGTFVGIIEVDLLDGFFDAHAELAPKGFEFVLQGLDGRSNFFLLGFAFFVSENGTTLRFFHDRWGETEALGCMGFVDDFVLNDVIHIDSSFP